MNDRQPLKAVGGGTITYMDQGEGIGYGKHAIVSHAGGWQSLYGHMCSWLTFPNSSQINQGEWIGGAGNTGFVDPTPPSGSCFEMTNLPGGHLHFEMRLNGIPQNATLSGFSILHLSQSDPPGDPPPDNEVYNPDVPHTSNNSGPGYYADTQFATGMREKYGDLGATPGSTYSSNQGPCNDPSRWLHTCYVGVSDLLLTQNFISATGVPSSLTSDPNVVDFWYVYGEFWTVYGQEYEQLGHPTADRVMPCPSGAPYGCVSYQQFECGFIYYDGSVSRAIVTCGFDGLYAITTGGQYKRLIDGGTGWVTKTGTPPGGSQNLKSFGNGLMVHKEGTGGGQTFRVSEDGGETWAQTAAPGGSFAPVDADYCAGSLWLAWLDLSGSPDVLRIYKSGDFGGSIGLPSLETTTTAVHVNGGVACSRSIPGRVAAVVQNGTGNARLAVSTDDGDNWTVLTKGLGTSNAFRAAWAGTRLLVTNNVTYTHLIRSSDDNGNMFTTRLSFGDGSVVSAERLDIIATEIPGLLFGFLYQSSVNTDGIWRSLDNGTSWQLVAAYPAGFGTNQSDPKGISYDAENDDLYVAFRSAGKVSRLPDARTRNWATVTSSDWITIPQVGTEVGLRAFTVVTD